MPFSKGITNANVETEAEKLAKKIGSQRAEADKIAKEGLSHYLR